MGDEEPEYMKEIEAIRQGQGEGRDAPPKPTVAITYAPSDRAKCKESSCKGPISKGTLRILKTSVNENIGHNMAVSYHAECFFCKTMLNARAWRYLLSESGEIEPPLDQFEDLTDLDKETIKTLVAKGNALKEEKGSKKGKKRPAKDADGDDDDEDESVGKAGSAESEPSLAATKPKRAARPASKKPDIVTEEELKQILSREGMEDFDEEDVKPKRKLKKKSKKAADDDEDDE
jgi:hypothetical protein